MLILRTDEGQGGNVEITASAGLAPASATSRAGQASVSLPARD